MSAKRNKVIGRNRFKIRSLVLVVVGIGIGFILGSLIVSSLAQERKAEEKKFPDLVVGLKATPGCLGVETARTESGKNVIFAWFENKQAVLKWYYSDIHQQAMRMFFPNFKPGEPLKGVPDDVGPIMAIASLTLTDKPQFKGTTLPLSQMSIELYAPITGGIFAGGRFAPDSLKVPNMRDYTPKEK